MRFTLILAVAVVLTPVALTARPAGLQAQPITDLSAAKKHHKKPKAQKPKEEYLKAAPGAGPSGPSK
jgi:hypothetical protein